MAIRFDVELGRFSLYGRGGVKLVIKNNSLGFEWCHYEPDTDVKPHVPRAFFAWTGADKDSIHETNPQ